MTRDVVSQQTANRSPLLVVLSGPSGVGKDTVLHKMKGQNHPCRHYAVTATTRKPRTGEKDGIDYYFFSESVFQQMVQQDAFLEWAKVYGNWYGVPKQQVKDALARGEDVLIKVDVQGATTIKKKLPQAILIFLTVTSPEELIQRLKQRDTDSGSSMELRIVEVQQESKCLPMFDYIVMNHKDKADLAVSQMNAIINAEKLRLKPREIKLCDIN